jgi:hypothetical protein
MKDPIKKVESVLISMVLIVETYVPIYYPFKQVLDLPAELFVLGPEEPEGQGEEETGRRGVRPHYPLRAGIISQRSNCEFN